MGDYEFLPECKTRGCTITTRDTSRFQRIYQHGDYPEAVCVIDARTVRHLPDPCEAMNQQLQVFIEACHRYEDGGGRLMPDEQQTSVLGGEDARRFCEDCAEVCERCGHTAGEHLKGFPCEWSGPGGLSCPCRHMILDGEEFVH